MASFLRNALGRSLRSVRSAAISPAAVFSGTAARAQYTTAAHLLTASGTKATAASLVGAALLVASAPVAWAASAEERSFIMIKPDGVHRGLIADVIKRFEAKGYKLVGIKVLVPTADLAGQHYVEHDGKPFYPKLVKFLSSGAVVAMVWEGKDVVKYGRTMIGATNPTASAPGTIRGDLAIDMGRNIIHGSDSTESAQKEIALWFKPSELADYQAALASWIYE